jgi:hypothetical protein
VSNPFSAKSIGNNGWIGPPRVAIAPDTVTVMRLACVATDLNGKYARWIASPVVARLGEAAPIIENSPYDKVNSAGANNWSAVLQVDGNDIVWFCNGDNGATPVYWCFDNLDEPHECVYDTEPPLMT